MDSYIDGLQCASGNMPEVHVTVAASATTRMADLPVSIARTDFQALQSTKVNENYPLAVERIAPG